MSFSHPIGDMITRIRNAQNAGKEQVSMPASGLRQNVLGVLKDEGFIEGFKMKKVSDAKSEIIVDLKYVQGAGAIQEIRIVSKPGRRVYSKSTKLPKVLNGLGVVIVSTPKGVMADYKARKENLGGEVLCQVI
ncbi:MAG: 30S ribosomal protein S8 [Rickettsiales bacterium]|jgi:small subunit ribosomal protein S8|nr:30S ribosomal protein S8 [Rickettsiales bacterium]